MIYLSIFSFAMYGVCEAMMDNIAHGKMKTFGTWRSKYKLPFEKGYKHWYYFGLYKPNYREKFPFSTSLLVSFTDGWHLLKFFSHLFLYTSIGVVVGYKFIPFLIVVRGITFNLFYKNKP